MELLLAIAQDGYSLLVAKERDVNVSRGLEIWSGVEKVAGMRKVNGHDAAASGRDGMTAIQWVAVQASRAELIR